MKGKIVFFNTVKGWGFIAPDDRDSDVFVHASGLEDSNAQLNQGDEVEFELENNGRGECAIKVRKLEEQ